MPPHPSFSLRDGGGGEENDMVYYSMHICRISVELITIPKILDAWTNLSCFGKLCVTCLREASSSSSSYQKGALQLYWSSYECQCPRNFSSYLLFPCLAEVLGASLLFFALLLCEAFMSW